MALKTYEKVCLALILLIIVFRYAPDLYHKITNDNSVKVGQIWQANMPVLIFQNNALQREVMQITQRKVVSVENGIVKYVIKDDSIIYEMPVNEFTFNGNGLKSAKISD